MEVTILNKNGRSVRQLTNNERKLIDSLDLDQQEKDFIAKKWESNKSPLPQGKQKFNLFAKLVSLFQILLPFALLIQFFDPSAGVLYGVFGEVTQKVVEMVIEIGYFVTGILILAQMVLIIVLFLFKLALLASKTVKDESLGLVGMLKKKNKVRTFFFDFIALLTVVGLILASHQIIAFIYLVVYVVLKWIYKSIKRTIKRQIIEYAKSEKQTN